VLYAITRPQPRRRRRVLANLGSSWIQSQTPAKARELLERALTIYERQLGPDHLAVAATLGILGNAWIQPSPAKARELLERALAIYEQYLAQPPGLLHG
jgi:hypothetical protein